MAAHYLVCPDGYFLHATTWFGNPYQPMYICQDSATLSFSDYFEEMAVTEGDPSEWMGSAYLACTGDIGSSGGVPTCSGDWVTKDFPTLSLTELDSAAIASLCAAALVTCALAYGVRVTLKSMGLR